MSDDTSTRLRCVTPPATEPVTLSEAKLFLRIEHVADDAMITLAIAAARTAAEQFLGMAFLPQSWEYTVGPLASCHLRLPFGPATAIDSIDAISSEGVSTTVSASNYQLSHDGYTVIFDTVPTAASVVVQYDASVADNAGALSSLIKQGILHHVVVLVEYRGGAAPLPIAALQSYQPFRRISL